MKQFRQFRQFGHFQPNSLQRAQSPLERLRQDNPPVNNPKRDLPIASMNPDADDTFDFTIYVGEEEEEE